MMKRKILIGSFTILLLMFAPLANAELTNPSFEDNDDNIDDITSGELIGWDVNMSAGFGGKVRSIWVTDANYSLEIYAEPYFNFVDDTFAYIEQSISSDVEQVMFDLKMEATVFSIPQAWNTVKNIVFVLVNDELVWESNGLGAGEFIDLNAVLTSVTEPNNLKIGYLVLGGGDNDGVSYSAFFDNFRLITSGPCGGNNYLYTDLDFSCYVDMNDFALLANYWLYDDFPRHVCDIYEDGIINMLDYAELAADYGKCSEKTDSNCIAGDWIPQDITGDGIVNFKDYAEIIYNGGDVNDVINIAEQWLMEFHIEETLPQ